MPAMSRLRIVSLLPGCTEIVCALDRGMLLAGRSHECDFPPEVQKLPVCSRPRIDSGAPSVEIDRQVKSMVQQALSIYEIDLAKLEELRPHLILTQTQCDVCAVSQGDLEQALARVAGFRPKILSIAPARMADLWAAIHTIAEELDAVAQARELLAQLKNRVVDVLEKTCAMTRRQTVACVEWIEPLMAAGHWTPELVDFAGGVNLIGLAGQRSQALAWDALAKADPEVMVFMPCGFDLKRTRQELSPLTQRPEWKKLKAVRQGKVFLADGNQFFNRPGPRLVDSLEIMAEILHPSLFPFGQQGTGWERL